MGFIAVISTIVYQGEPGLTKHRVHCNTFMILMASLMLLLVACLQVASSDQWVLGVQIQNFMNMHNAEVRNDNYCCCDGHFKQCRKNITDLNGMCFNSTERCEAYFVLYVRECSSQGTCTDTESYQLNPSRSSLKQLVLSIPLDTMELIKNVRKIKTNYLLHLI